MIDAAGRILRNKSVLRELLKSTETRDPGWLREAPHDDWKPPAGMECYRMDSWIGEDNNVYIIAHLPGTEVYGEQPHFGVQLVAQRYATSCVRGLLWHPVHILSVLDDGIQIVSVPQTMCPGTKEPTYHGGILYRYYGADWSLALQEFFTLMHGDTIAEARTVLGALAKVAIYQSGSTEAE